MPKPTAVPDNVVALDQFASEFDAVAHSRRYKGLETEQVTLYNVPIYVVAMVRRVIAVAKPARGEFAPVISACVEAGTRAIRQSEMGSDLLASIAEAEELAGSGRALVALEQWRGSRLVFADPYRAGHRRLDFRCPCEIKNQVFDLGSALGLSGSSVGALALIAGLVEQDAVPDDARAHLEAEIKASESFLVGRVASLNAAIAAVSQ